MTSQIYSYLPAIIILLLLNPGFLIAQEGDIKGGKHRHRHHYFELGKEALESEQHEEAVRYFDQGLQYDVYHVESYFLRAMAKENLGDRDGALTDYNIILHMRPDFVEALFSRGMLYYNMGRFDFAEKDFTKLLETPVAETSSIFFKISNYESGVSEVMTMKAKEAEVYNYLGLVKTKLKKYDNAIRDFDQAINLNPAEPNFFINRGLAYEEKLMVDRAKMDYNQALKIDPGNDLARYNLLRLSDDEKSVELYTDLIREDPEFAEPYAQRGLARFNSGDFRGALEDYDKAISLNASDHENYFNRGLIREKLVDLNGAFKDFSKAIELKADYSKAYLSRGNVQTRKREFQSAIKDYDVSISLDPLNPISFYNRGVAKYSIGDFSACDDVTRAFELGMESARKAVNTMCAD